MKRYLKARAIPAMLTKTAESATPLRMGSLMTRKERRKSMCQPVFLSFALCVPNLGNLATSTVRLDHKTTYLEDLDPKVK
jgi:hypothetical protein